MKGLFKRFQQSQKKQGGYQRAALVTSFNACPLGLALVKSLKG
jgi:hypothetical protein